MKLIRDRVPEIMKKEGKDPITRIANDGEFADALNIKLKEEVSEFLAKKETAELVDIMEVVYAIGKSKGLSVSELEKMRKQKASDRGSFEKRIIWEGNRV